MSMNIDNLQVMINNGFDQLRQPDANQEYQIKTLEVMASLLKHKAKHLKDNALAQVKVNIHYHEE